MRYWTARDWHRGPVGAIQYFAINLHRLVKIICGELLDRTLIRNQNRLWHAQYHNEHRIHRSLTGAAPVRAWPKSLEPDQIGRLRVDRQDRLGGFIHEDRYAT